MDFTKFTSGLTDVYLEEYLAVSEKFDKFFFCDNDFKAPSSSQISEDETQDNA